MQERRTGEREKKIVVKAGLVLRESLQQKRRGEDKSASGEEVHFFVKLVDIKDAERKNSISSQDHHRSHYHHVSKASSQYH